MSNRTNRQWRLKNRPKGRIERDDFDWVESEVPDLEDEQILVRNIFLSLDPTIRTWMRASKGYVDPIGIGDVIKGLSLGVVVESTTDKFDVGDVVSGMFGWQDYKIVGGKDLRPVNKIPTNLGVPLETFLGPMGMNGLTAYFGVMDIGEPKEGETFYISAAAGATGSIAGQIAKIHGCRVVGSAGSDEKCEWLVNELGYDAAFNYKTTSYRDGLKEHCPDGIDIYFDNVGGDALEATLNHINIGARLVICGMISMYNASKPQPGPANLGNLITKRARMEGFLILDYWRQYNEALMQIGQWIMSGQIKYQIDIADGLENTIEVYNRLFEGKNKGKLLIQVSDVPSDI